MHFNNFKKFLVSVCPIAVPARLNIWAHQRVPLLEIFDIFQISWWRFGDFITVIAKASKRLHSIYESRICLDLVNFEWILIHSLLIHFSQHILFKLLEVLLNRILVYLLPFGSQEKVNLTSNQFTLSTLWNNVKCESELDVYKIVSTFLLPSTRYEFSWKILIIRWVIH